MLDCLIARNHYDEAFQLYEDTTAMYFREIGMEPSEAMKERLEKIQNANYASQTTLDRIREQLENNETWDYGPYDCPLPRFIDNYQFVKYTIQRSGQAASVLVMTMEDSRKVPLTPGEDPAVRLAQYQALHERNSDMAGWIRIPDTVIDYPVMHTPEDPEYYFHRDFEKNYSSYGMIFLDGDCRLDGTSPNLVLYGHHMRNGSMFAQIQSYDDPEYWQAHPLIQFDTLEELGTYEVLGAFKAPAAELDEEFKQMLLAQTEEDYGRLMDYLEGRRFYDTGVDASYPRQLITLTTCEYTQKDGRFFVVAAKVEE